MGFTNDPHTYISADCHEKIIELAQIGNYIQGLSNRVLELDSNNEYKSNYIIKLTKIIDLAADDYIYHIIKAESNDSGCLFCPMYAECKESGNPDLTKCSLKLKHYWITKVDGKTSVSKAIQTDFA